MAAGKVCLVLGAGEKLGFAVARKYAQSGFKVVVSRRSEFSAADLAKIGGANVSSAQCDVTKEDDIKALVSKVEKEQGPIHTVIYNAGTGTWKTWDNVTMEEFDRSFNTNTRGLLMLAKAVCPGMVERGEGVLGITGATASLRGKPFTSAFAAAKGSQRMLAQSLARDLGPKGIHVFLAIIDGQIKENDETNKFLNPDEIAESYYNIASQGKSAWTFEADLRPFQEQW
ncbi:uncharacterized protein LOC111714714 [Eurytemora carolleeae]|uniref:uncharacterized protein LOC111714714 n=1 Tax=Eurytemora carolleeae TaxID=1294199 RepID=UPI000C765642|nr:uncharacterized protein LOC111714714 [Eurytemora carolleeae]|eukprot:XP_023345642.1 uncharacterized protein LOC111714714 [Eurytemora affinis]